MGSIRSSSANDCTILVLSFRMAARERCAGMARQAWRVVGNGDLRVLRRRACIHQDAVRLSWLSLPRALRVGCLLRDRPATRRFGPGAASALRDCRIEIVSSLTI